MINKRKQETKCCKHNFFGRNYGIQAFKCRFPLFDRSEISTALSNAFISKKLYTHPELLFKFYFSITD